MDGKAVELFKIVRGHEYCMLSICEIISERQTLPGACAYEAQVSADFRQI